MHAPTPFFSIIVPVLNSVDTIQKSINSVLKQNLDASYELLVFDGGSTDGTVEVLRGLLRPENYLSTSPDNGPHYAVNNALKIAKGEVIVILCADDYLENGALSKIQKIFIEDPDLDLLTCGIKIFHSDGRLLKCFLKQDELEFSIRNILKTPLSHGRFIKKRVYESIGGFPEKYRLCNDLYLFLKIKICKNIKSKTLELNSYNYLHHVNSATMGADHYKILTTYIDNYLITSYFIEKFKTKINLVDLYFFYSLQYKSFIKAIIKYKQLKHIDIKILKSHFRTLLRGLFFTPFIFCEYLIQKLKL